MLDCIDYFYLLGSDTTEGARVKYGCLDRSTLTAEIRRILSKLQDEFLVSNVDFCPSGRLCLFLGKEHEEQVNSTPGTTELHPSSDSSPNPVFSFVSEWPCTCWKWRHPASCVRVPSHPFARLGGTLYQRETFEPIMGIEIDISTRQSTCFPGDVIKGTVRLNVTAVSDRLCFLAVSSLPYEVCCWDGCS